MAAGCCIFVHGPDAGAAVPAPHSQPLYVLDLDTEDSEEQAEALTLALRSRARVAPGFSLLETNQGLGALLLALKCPPKPDAACLLRIGDQLKADRYIWGTLAKASAPRMVTAELHYWQRGKADLATRESFTDNLRDGADEALRRVATRLFDRTTGSPSSGTLLVRSNVDQGIVYVDGVEQAVLEHGASHFEIPVGSHAVEVRDPGLTAPLQQVAMAAGDEVSVSFTLAPPSIEDVPTHAEHHKAASAGRIVGWTALGLGVVSLGVAGVEGLRFLSERDSLNAKNGLIPTRLDVCSNEAERYPDQPAACAAANNAQNARTIGLIFGGAGVVVGTLGVVLIVSSGSAHESPNSHSPIRQSLLRVLPHGGAHGGGIDLIGQF